MIKKFPFAYMLLCGGLAVLTACSGKSGPSETEEQGVSTILPETKNEVTTAVLKKQNFHHELVSNGKVNARNKSDLRFETGEVVAHIYVKNGDRVRKGQKLAELDKYRLEHKLSQAEDALLRAELDLKDLLIGQGYSIDEIGKVPADILKIVKVKSGYDQAKSQRELVKRETAHATLVAPFDGVVANLFAKAYNLANPSEVFCTILDTGGMEVEFTVLENELSFIKKGDQVAVTPYAGGDVFAGYVSEINPLVEANGMVKVKAGVNGGNGLFSGMNVRVSVKRNLGQQLVIPKTAVVLRSGKQVVFTLKNGKAAWNYVHTGLENATQYIVSDKSKKDIEEGLLEGDTVIVTGNLNLAHEAEIDVK